MWSFICITSEIENYSNKWRKYKNDMEVNDKNESNKKILLHYK